MKKINMKSTYMRKRSAAVWMAAASLAVCCQSNGWSQTPAQSDQPHRERVVSETVEVTEPAPRHVEERVIVRSLEKEAERDPAHASTWLGLGTEEASEALSAQLQLPPGVGLVVTYLAPEGPAAKAGLQKNDILISFEGDGLVHPSQLRKLVQVRKKGDEVKLGYLRNGKKAETSVILAETSGSWPLGDQPWQKQEHWQELQRHLRELPLKEAAREQMNALRDSLGNLKIDQKKVQEEIKRNMEQARKAIEEALQQARRSNSAMQENMPELQGLMERAEKESTVTVRSNAKNIRSLVRSDDDGTVVIVANPKLRMTAHDKEGNLIFDGKIDSAQEREKVPADLWKKVQPMLKDLEPPQPAAEDDERD